MQTKFYLLLLSTENVLIWAWVRPERFEAVWMKLERIRGADEFGGLAEEGPLGEVCASLLT